MTIEDAVTKEAAEATESHVRFDANQGLENNSKLNTTTTPPSLITLQSRGSGIRSSEQTPSSKAGLRSGVRLNVADRKQVEVSTTSLRSKGQTIHSRDIIKIFTSDNEFIEVSPEQMERIKTMHARMEDGATFSFNYNTLLLVASVIAGLGLVSNASATIIASMLVSPIM